MKLLKSCYIDLPKKDLTDVVIIKFECIVYLEYCNNRRIKAKLKGLPSDFYRKQALSDA